MVGLGAATFMLVKHLNETEAKMRLMTDSTSRKLGQQLGFSADETVKLSQALAQLGDQAGPSGALLERVAKNAKQMGADPSEAVGKFVAAWKEGPEAINKVQKEIGDLGFKMQTLPQIARSMGLDPRALGLNASKATADQLKDALAEVGRGTENVHALEMQISDKYGDQVDASTKQRLALQAQIGPIEQALDLTQRKLETDQASVQFLKRKLQAEQDFADVTKRTGEIAANVEAEASLHGNRRVALGIRISGIQRQQTELETAIAKQQDLVNRGTGKEAEDRLKVLQLARKQLDVQAFQVVEADKQERRAKAQAAAQEAAANRAATIDARLRTQKAQADRDGIQTERERIAILDAEQQKELDATKTVKSKKVRAEQQKAIDQDYATKRAQLDRQLVDESAKTDDDIAKYTADSMQKTTDRVRQAADATVATERARSASIADSLRAQGREQEAAETERRQAHADYQAALTQIDRERDDAIKTLVAGSTDALKTEELAEQKRLQARIALDDQERKLQEAAHERARQSRSDAAASLEGPAAALKALGQLGNLGAGAAGDGLVSLVKGFKDLDQAMSRSKVKSAEVAGAIGTAVAGVANSAIDYEKARTTAQLDADEQRALSTATSEQERAAITTDYEARKAKAVEDAERKKAAIMAVVELAQAIASAAQYDYVAAAGHAAAAVAFGAIAGGLAGGVPAGGGGSSAAAGFSQPASQTGGQSAGGNGSGNTYVFQFNQPLVTKQDIGRSVHGALRTLSGTGTDRAKGA